jgi:ABC-type transport system involved in multi-copper enzyme maturation permease subunit
MNCIKEFKSSIQSWRFVTIVVIVIGVKGVGDSRGEKQLFLFLVTILEQNMNNFLKHTMVANVLWF